MTCKTCDGTGVEETGNNDLPCHCPLGDAAQFNLTGVEGLVTGAEIKRHFHNGSPEPLDPDPRTPMKADDLPGRGWDDDPLKVS